MLGNPIVKHMRVFVASLMLLFVVVFVSGPSQLIKKNQNQQKHPQPTNAQFQYLAG